MAKTHPRKPPRSAAAKAAPAKAKPRLRTRTDLGDDAVRDISAGLAALLADTFALYLKTKNFHWHMSGPHFRDFHLLLDEQSDQIFAMTDPMAERARKIGGTTLHSIGEIARKQRIADNDADYVDPQDMLAELAQDNLQCVAAMRSLHATCDEHSDVATASLSRSGSTRASAAPGSSSRPPAPRPTPPTDRRRNAALARTLLASHGRGRRGIPVAHSRAPRSHPPRSAAAR